MIRYFLLAFCVILSYAVKAQSDSIVFSDSTVIHYNLKLASGNRMPSIVVALMPSAIGVDYNYINGAYLSFEARTSLYYPGMDINSGEFFIPLYTRRKLGSTGKMLIGERIEYPRHWKYYVGFNAVSRYNHFGLSGGALRFNASNIDSYYEEGDNTDIIPPRVVSMNGFELGLGFHSKTGLILTTHEATHLNFAYHKIDFRLTYYTSRAVVYSGDTVMNGNVPLGSDIPSSQLYPSKFGARFNYSYQLSTSSKMRDSRLFGSWFPVIVMRVQVRYNPLLTYSNVILTTGFGIGFAMRPRYYIEESYDLEKFDRAKPERQKIKEGKSTKRELYKDEN